MADFAAVHERLRRILEPYRADLSVMRDGPDGLVLEVPGLEGKPVGLRRRHPPPRSATSPAEPAAPVAPPVVRQIRPPVVVCEVSVRSGPFDVPEA